MDIFQTARYFDTQNFDYFDFTNNVWVTTAFKGQLKKTDTFTEIWNRPTRKRLLSCAPDQEPQSPVIRVPESGEIFMVGASHKDVWDGYYRFIAGLHKIRGSAIVRRRAPVGPSNDPGYAVESVVINTFGDCELRSADENQDREIEHYGSYFMFLPINTSLNRDDSVEISGVRYFVLESYVDSGLMCARATSQPDDRIDAIFVSLGAETYDTNTQQSTRTPTSYHVTGRVKPLHAELSNDENILATELTFLIKKSWIGVEPKIDDKLTIGSKTNRVIDVAQNSLLDEWYLKLGN